MKETTETSIFLAVVVLLAVVLPFSVSASDNADKTFTSLKKRVANDMKELTKLRKKLGFDEPALIFDVIANKIDTDVGTLTGEDTDLLKEALRELADALREDNRAELQEEAGKRQWIEKQMESIRQDRRQTLNVRGSATQQRWHLKSQFDTLKAYRLRSEKRTSRLPRQLETDIGRLERRFANYQKLLTEYAKMSE